MKKILVTGGCGNIGKHFVDHNHDQYSIRVADIELSKEVFPKGVTAVQADVKDYNACLSICKDIDVVVHLAGVVDFDTAHSFDEVLETNILGTKNIFKAAIAQGCKKIIYASSAQTIENYPLDVSVKENMLMRPKSFYGISKSFSEALAAYHAFENKIVTIGLRIGAYEFPENHTGMSARDLSAFTHPDDLNQLFSLCIEAEGLQFEVFNAISDNRFKRLDITEAKTKLGYSPQYDAFKIFKTFES